MSFQNKAWAHRFMFMGDAAERQFVEHVDGKCERWGLNRPEGVHVPSLPSRVRAAPDFLTNEYGWVECMGMGRKQVLQLKWEKLDSLKWWQTILPVHLFIWDSHRKRKVLVSLKDIERLINTPDLCSTTYFDGNKLAFQIPAADLFEEAA